MSPQPAALARRHWRARAESRHSDESPGSRQGGGHTVSSRPTESQEAQPAPWKRGPGRCQAQIRANPEARRLGALSQAAGSPHKESLRGPPGAAGGGAEGQEAGGAPGWGWGEVPPPLRPGAEGAGRLQVQPCHSLRGTEALVPLGAALTAWAALARAWRGLPRGDGGLRPRPGRLESASAPCPASGSTTARRPSSWSVSKWTQPFGPARSPEPCALEAGRRRPTPGPRPLSSLVCLTAQRHGPSGSRLGWSHKRQGTESSSPRPPLQTQS